MELKRHYPHMCFQAVRSSYCENVQRAISMMIGALRVGARTDPRIHIELTVRDAVAMKVLSEQREFKLKSRSAVDRWGFRAYLRASELEQQMKELPYDISRDVVEMRLQETKTGEEHWIPRWFICYDISPDLNRAMSRRELLMMKAANEVLELSSDQRKNLIDLIIAGIDIEDNGWEYAYIEMSDETEHGMANSYGPMLGAAIRWNDAIRYRLWQVALESEGDATRERRSQRPCKGVYWGNLFGPEILARLGGRDPFIAEFEAAREQAGSDGAWLREMRNGGVFFTLSGELLDCWHVTASPLISFSPSLRMAVWLWDRLRNAGLLL